MSEEHVKIDKVFVDKKLENQILRYLISDDRVDESNDFEQLTRNVGYILGIGIPIDAFSDEFKQWLYKYVTENYQKHSQASSRSIILKIIELKFRKGFKNKQELLDDIFKYEPKIQNFKSLIDEFIDNYNCRCLLERNLELNSKLQENFESKKYSALELAQQLNDETGKMLSFGNRNRLEEREIYEFFDNDVREMEKIRESDEEKIIPTGFPEIDKAMGGWGPGELSVIFGRTGAGKSILLLNFARNAYMMGYNVYYYTIELSMRQMMWRWHSLVSKVNFGKVKRPKNMEEVEYDFFKKMITKDKNEHMNGRNFFTILDKPDESTYHFIESRITSYENKVGKKTDLIIVDPLYFMMPSDPKTDDKYGQVTIDLKRLAKKLDTPILTASQLNRESHKRHQKGQGVDTMDASFSDRISHSCDNMIVITCPDPNESIAKLSFPKTRDSALKTLLIEKNFECMKFQTNEKMFGIQDLKI